MSDTPFHQGGTPPSTTPVPPAPAPVPPPETSSAAPSASDESVRDRASTAASHAADAGKDVAHEATERLGGVAQEAGRRTRSLLDDARAQVSSQASDQQGRLAGGLRHLGSELTEMSRASEDPGYASQFADRGSQAADRLADWFDQREPGDVLHEVQDFARRRPGVFLAVAAGAGLLVGRLLRGVKDAPDDGSAQHRDATSGVASGASASGATGTTPTGTVPTGTVPTGTTTSGSPSAGTTPSPSGTGVGTGGESHVVG
ncbi:hypothetical protein M1843_11910 [Isoptericola sp. 4D.3]|uniref:Uncharacterized protein n=1 Tax=Isoptericola peretonis TaxID=2918523 RepID=A0ABT0J4M2_9MICO|nr:hypothetical protein [Isoptericola sp. 4D.3]